MMSLTLTAGQRIFHVLRVDIAEKHINDVEKVKLRTHVVTLYIGVTQKCIQVGLECELNTA